MTRAGESDTTGAFLTIPLNQYHAFCTPATTLLRQLLTASPLSATLICFRPFYKRPHHGTRSYLAWAFLALPDTELKAYRIGDIFLRMVYNNRKVEEATQIPASITANADHPSKISDQFLLPQAQNTNLPLQKNKSPSTRSAITATNSTADAATVRNKLADDSGRQIRSAPTAELSCPCWYGSHHRAAHFVFVALRTSSILAAYAAPDAHHRMLFGYERSPRIIVDAFTIHR